jgi:hypothetical protein
MRIPDVIWIASGVAVLVLFAVWVLFALRARKINLTKAKSPDQKPEWMRTTPPPETVAATRADGERVALYDYDAGEHVAAPFSEQIEDILRTRLNADPALAGMDIDLGTAPDGGLEIWVDGERYTDVDLLPDERLRRMVRQVVEEWDAGTWESR